MDALEAIFTRRSIRHFTPQPVPAEDVDKMLRAAMQAPSSNNEQAWHFVVITQREILDAIPAFHLSAEMVREAPIAFVICGDETLEKSRGRWVVDCSAATENLLLAAHALGYGAVWCGLYGNADRTAGMRKLLGLPDHILPLGLVPVGFPAEDVPPVDRYLAERVHRERW